MSLITRRTTEFLILLFFVIVLLIAVTFRLTVSFYFLLLLLGIINGRAVYLNRSKRYYFSVSLVLLALITIWLAPFSQLYGFAVFAFGAAISFYLHFKKIVGNFKSPDFLK